MEQEELNVLGTPLKSCSQSPRTGFFRDGYCRTCFEDRGIHTVCAQMTSEFLEFSKSCGNDLTTPIEEFCFPGLQEADLWCLCASRWLEAYRQGRAPMVDLEATHEETLAIIPLEALKEFAIKK